MKTKLFLLLIMAVFGSEKYENDGLIFVKIEETEYDKKKTTSEYIGVFYYKRLSKWRANRWSKNEKKTVGYGSYDIEETAARASDTLARQLMGKGEQDHKLNFPDDHIEVHPEEKAATSDYFGVTYNKRDYIGVAYSQRDSKWRAYRHSKNEKKTIGYGNYDNEETAAHASDTLARKLMEKSKQKLKLNFPDDHTEVHPVEKIPTSEYFGVHYNKRRSTWYVRRHSKYEGKKIFYGSFDNEETAAHASDTFARKLMENGEQSHKLNFPDDHTEVHPIYQKQKRKRQDNVKDN